MATNQEFIDDTTAMLRLLRDVELVAPLSDLAASLLAVAPALPCPTCGGCPADPIEVDPPMTRRLDEAVLALIVALDDLVSVLPVRVLLGPTSLRWAQCVLDSTPELTVAALEPVSEIVARCVRQGLGAALESALCLGAGVLVPDVPCRCG